MLVLSNKSNYPHSLPDLYCKHVNNQKIEIIVKKHELIFQGYTWEDYFYVIENKPGILVTYRGGLDKEGAVRLDEIIYVADADELSMIYNSESFKRARSKVNETDRLFFSYSEQNCDERKDVAECLRATLLSQCPHENENNGYNLICKGACALFPKEIISEV